MIQPHRPGFSSSLLLCSCLLSLSLSAWGVEQPDSGSLLDSTRPLPGRLPSQGSPLPAPPKESTAPGAAAGLRVNVKEFKISGNTAISSDALQALLAEARGKEHSITELQKLAQGLTEHYRAAGYFLARAYLPPQNIKQGVVQIAILEGRLGEVRTHNFSPIAQATLDRPLARLRPGEVVSGSALERSILLLSDLPGIQASSTLKPGASVGTTDLDIRIVGDKPFTADLGLDNHGSRYTGAHRLSGGISFNSPFGGGETLSLRGSTAGADFNYGRIAFQTPLGGDGFKLGLARSTMDYQLGKDFASLQAHGKADITSVYALYPLVRSSTFNVNTQLLFDRKALRDQVDVSNTRTEKDLDVFTLGLSGDRVSDDAKRNLRWNLGWTSGKLQLDAASLALDQTGHKTQGHYDKLNLQGSLLQALTGSLQLFAQVQGQQAAKNLDSSEKMSLGGANAVRAYPQGEASSDDAWLMTLELRQALAPGWQLSGFVDAASGKRSHKPLATDRNNQRNLSGIGLGINWANQSGTVLQTSLAWRTASQPTADRDKTPRIWLQLVQYF